MRLHRPKVRKVRARGQQVILFTIGTTTFAIAASMVTEIQSLQEVKSLGTAGRRFGKVHHTLEREGRKYWVVDANIHFGILPTQSSRVLLLAEHPVAVKVDGIERMTEISRVLPLPKAFSGDERTWYLGLTLIEGVVIPMVNPSAFLSSFELDALEARVPVVAQEMAGATA